MKKYKFLTFCLLVLRNLEVLSLILSRHQLQVVVVSSTLNFSKCFLKVSCFQIKLIATKKNPTRYNCQHVTVLCHNLINIIRLTDLYISYISKCTIPNIVLPPTVKETRMKICLSGDNVFSFYFHIRQRFIMFVTRLFREQGDINLCLLKF